MIDENGRLLKCTHCGDLVRVYEAPVRHIDPARYVCGDCLEPTQDPVDGQLELDDGTGIREHHVRYNPTMSEIPY